MLVAGALLVSTQVFAEKGDWLGRVRVINVSPSVSSSVAGLDVSREAALEVDVSYFLTKNVALELIATDRSFNVTLAGASLGSVKLLPPTLTVQYHFNPGEKFKPYVGAGINYTRFHGANLALGATPLSVDNSSTGGALQAGLDVEVGKNVFFNVDVKKIWISTDVKNATTGALVTNLKIDPVIVGIGVGMKF